MAGDNAGRGRRRLLPCHVPSDPAGAADGLAPAPRSRRRAGAGCAAWVRSAGYTRPDGSRLKVPHVGWDDIHLVASVRWNRPAPCSMMWRRAPTCTLRTASRRTRIPILWSPRARITRAASLAQFGKHRVFGCQFRPVSSAHGLQVLRNFASIVVAARGRRVLYGCWLRYAGVRNAPSGRWG